MSAAVIVALRVAVTPQVAFTAFTRVARDQVRGRLIVRRIPDVNAARNKAAG